VPNILSAPERNRAPQPFVARFVACARPGGAECGPAGRSSASLAVAAALQAWSVDGASWRWCAERLSEQRSSASRWGIASGACRSRGRCRAAPWPHLRGGRQGRQRHGRMALGRQHTSAPGAGRRGDGRPRLAISAHPGRSAPGCRLPCGSAGSRASPGSDARVAR